MAGADPTCVFSTACRSGSLSLVTYGKSLAVPHLSTHWFDDSLQIIQILFWLFIPHFKLLLLRCNL